MSLVIFKDFRHSFSWKTNWHLPKILRNNVSFEKGSFLWQRKSLLNLGEGRFPKISMSQNCVSKNLVTFPIPRCSVYQTFGFPSPRIFGPSNRNNQTPAKKKLPSWWFQLNCKTLVHMGISENTFRIVPVHKNTGDTRGSGWPCTVLFSSWNDLPVEIAGENFASRSHTHRIHIWYICLHLVDFYGKCR